jgi:trigger factor
MALPAGQQREGDADRDQEAGEQIAEEYEKLSKSYNMPVDKIKGMLSEASIKKDMQTEKALQIIKDTAVALEHEPSAEAQEDAQEEKKKNDTSKKAKTKSRKKADDESADAIDENEEKE